MNVQVITHYMIDDPDFRGDYTEVSILVEGEEIKRYGDYYHDKGAEKAEGFLDALHYVTRPMSKGICVERINLADYEG